MNKEERLKALQEKINGIIDELWEIIPEDSGEPNNVILSQDAATKRLTSAWYDVQELIRHYATMPDSCH